MIRKTLLSGMLVLQLNATMAAGSDSGGDADSPRRAEPSRSVASTALEQGLQSILDYYHGAKGIARFCSERFYDMQADLRETDALWTRRNAAAASAARHLALERRLAPDGHSLDEDLARQVSARLRSLMGVDQTQQKIICFDTMVLMDDESNDIRHRFRDQYEFLPAL